MLERKTFTYKDCIFSERNREDVNYSKYQDKVREEKIKFINKYFASVPDEKLALLLAEMRTVYRAEEIAAYIDGSIQSKREIIFDSFKVKNKRTFKEFNELFSDEEVTLIYKMLFELESNSAENLREQFEAFIKEFGELSVEDFAKELDIVSMNSLKEIANKFYLKKKMKT